MDHPAYLAVSIIRILFIFPHKGAEGRFCTIDDEGFNDINPGKGVGVRE